MYNHFLCNVMGLNESKVNLWNQEQTKTQINIASIFQGYQLGENLLIVYYLTCTVLVISFLKPVSHKPKYINEYTEHQTKYYRSQRQYNQNT